MGPGRYARLRRLPGWSSSGYRTIPHSLATELDISLLQNFLPIGGLKTDNRQALLKKINLRQAQRGEKLFKEGDTEKRTVYVLSGTIELKVGDEVVSTVEGDTATARNPISPVLPRH